MSSRINVAPGQTVRLELPFSEVCMHMRVAGQIRSVQLLPGDRAAQILNDDGSPFSAPVTPGEAGLYWDNEELTHYAYPKG